MMGPILIEAECHNIDLMLQSHGQGILAIVLLDEVITIDKHDIVARHGIQPHVSRYADASIGTMKGTDARVAACILVNDVGTAIGRAIVNQQNLDMGIGLGDK